METLVVALGGRGGVPEQGVPGARGGDGRALAVGRSFGDGNPVRVGFRLPPPPPRCLPWCASPWPRVLPPPYNPRPIYIVMLNSGAYGGSGGGFDIFRPEGTLSGGQGGDASSFSIGIAHGDSPVQVLDAARGGEGGAQARLTEALPSRGGQARSVAIGRGHGDSPVEVRADAEGGSAGGVGSFDGNRFDPYGSVATGAELEAPSGIAGGVAEAFVALFAPRVHRLGFVSLRARLAKEDEVLVDEFFDDPRQAARFLDRALLEVGPMGFVTDEIPPYSFRLWQPEVATLSLELRSRGGLEVGCLVGTAPLAGGWLPVSP